MGDRAAHPADLARRPADQPGIALPGAASARAARMDRGRLGHLRKQPPRQVLSPHIARAEAARRGARELAALHGRGRTRHADDVGPATMDFLHILARRIRANVRPLIARRRAEAELDEEMRFHVDTEVRSRIERGMSPDEALTSTLRDFGGVARFKDECRDAWSTRVADEMGRDIRYAARTLRRSPVFTAVAVLTVALGVGAATTIFSVMQGVLRPLPYDEPNALVAVRTVHRGSDDVTSALDFIDWRRQSTTLSGLAAISADPMNLTGGG